MNVSKPIPSEVDVDPRTAPPGTGDAPEPSWSPAAMVDRLGGDEELARQLIALFLGEYPKLMATLDASVSAGQPDAIRRAAHAAKGCIANFVEGGPQATAFRIEQLGAAGAVNEIAPLLSQLQREIDALAAAMIAFQESSCGS